MCVACSSIVSVSSPQSKIRNAEHVVFASVGREGEGEGDGDGLVVGICSDSASIIDKRSIWRLRAAPAGQTG